MKDPGSERSRDPRSSPPVSRILSRCRGRSSISGGDCSPPLAAYPGLDRRAAVVPVWPCSGWGLPSRPVTRLAGGLLPHRFTLACARLAGHRRFVLCGTFRRVTPPGRYPAPCPMESGLSSGFTPRPSGGLSHILLALANWFVGAATADCPPDSADGDGDQRQQEHRSEGSRAATEAGDGDHDSRHH